MSKFDHEVLSLNKDKVLVYTAMSKHYFYYRMFISVFTLEQGVVPLNPFMIFDYFLLDAVNRDLIREGNNNLVKRADEIWVFGPVSDGVLAEIKIAKKMKKPVRYFEIQKSRTIIPIDKKKVKMEEKVKDFRSEL